LARRSV